MNNNTAPPSVTNKQTVDIVSRRGVHQYKQQATLIFPRYYQQQQLDSQSVNFTTAATKLKITSFSKLSLLRLKSLTCTT